MRIIKHKDIEVTPADVRRILAGEKLPGLAVDRGPGFVSIGPLDVVNLTGEYGPGTEWEEVAPPD